MEVKTGNMTPQIKNVRHHQNLEGEKKDSSLKSSEGVNPADTLISDFWLPEL